MLNEARRRNLQRTLNPRTVCYIGGSFLEHTINANRRMGFNGEVWVVNPKLDSLAGIPCFKSVDDLPGAPDATFLAVNREMTNTIVTELNTCRCRFTCLCSSWPSTVPSSSPLARPAGSALRSACCLR